MHKILVIDDDDVLRGVVGTALRTNRFIALEAKDAVEGLKLAGAETPDLILCDLNLGQNGADDSLARLRSNASVANVPFILMTGQPGKTGDEDELLVKPFTLALLLATVRRHLSLPRSAQDQEIREKRGRARKLKNERTPPGLDRSGSLLRQIQMSSEEWRQLLARVQCLREAERKQVARAIHDDLSQKLTVLAIDLSLLESSLKSPLEKSVSAQALATTRKLSTLVNELIGSAQEIMAQLRPKVLDEFGFVAALEWLVQDFEKRTGIRCELTLRGAEGSLEAEIAAELFRLSQEILSRIAEQSDATAVSISLEERNGRLRMEITDNGARADLRENQKFDSLDLLVMRERAERLGGTFKITAEPQKGARAVVTVPVDNGGIM